MNTNSQLWRKTVLKEPEIFAPVFIPQELAKVLIQLALLLLWLVLAFSEALIWELQFIQLVLPLAWTLLHLSLASFSIPFKKLYHYLKQLVAINSLEHSYHYTKDWSKEVVRAIFRICFLSLSLFWSLQLMELAISLQEFQMAEQEQLFWA